jgi:hypothetical protein
MANTDASNEPVEGGKPRKAMSENAMEHSGEYMKKSMLDSDDEDDVDIDLIVESVMDQSVEKAVKQMIEEGPKVDEEATPAEKFNMLYKDIKSKKNETTSMDSTQMLAALFTEGQTKDPFDERKVMMKLRNMLHKEDFEGLFKDPVVGDIY